MSRAWQKSSAFLNQAELVSRAKCMPCFFCFLYQSELVSRARCTLHTTQPCFRGQAELVFTATDVHLWFIWPVIKQGRAGFCSFVAFGECAFSYCIQCIFFSKKLGQREEWGCGDYSWGWGRSKLSCYLQLERSNLPITTLRGRWGVTMLTSNILKCVW
jgi:hypothetical protein